MLDVQRRKDAIALNPRLTAVARTEDLIKLRDEKLKELQTIEASLSFDEMTARISAQMQPEPPAKDDIILELQILEMRAQIRSSQNDREIEAAFLQYCETGANAVLC